MRAARVALLGCLLAAAALATDVTHDVDSIVTTESCWVDLETDVTLDGRIDEIITKRKRSGHDVAVAPTKMRTTRGDDPLAVGVGLRAECCLSQDQPFH